MLYFLFGLLRLALGILFLPLYLTPIVSLHLLGRLSRPETSRLLLWWAQLLQRVNQGKREPKTRHQINALLFYGLLGQSAPWKELQQIRERQDDHGRPLGSAYEAFITYLLDENYDNALAAALEWCQITEEKVAGHEDEMRSFFSKWGTDFSGPTQHRIQMEACEKRRQSLETDSQGQPLPKITWREAKEDYVPIGLCIQYYRAHLSVEILQWIQTLDPARMRKAKSAARIRSRRTFSWMHKLLVDDSLARKMGMDETTLSQIRQRIINP